MFSNAKVGDMVFDYTSQEWGQIDAIGHEDQEYPINVSFDKHWAKAYTTNGSYSLGDVVPVLFWDEVKPIIPPNKPLPKLEVDTRVLVWYSDDKEDKLKRHFSHFDSNGNINCFELGTTSWSSNWNTTAWANWELAE